MYKKIIFGLLMACLLITTAACGEKKTLHCDKCGKEVTVSESSNMEEDWIVFCEECGDIEQ